MPEERQRQTCYPYVRGYVENGRQYIINHHVKRRRLFGLVSIDCNCGRGGMIAELVRTEESKKLLTDGSIGVPVQQTLLTKCELITSRCHLTIQLPC